MGLEALFNLTMTEEMIFVRSRNEEPVFGPYVDENVLFDQGADENWLFCLAANEVDKHIQARDLLRSACAPIKQTVLAQESVVGWPNKPMVTTRTGERVAERVDGLTGPPFGRLAIDLDP